MATAVKTNACETALLELFFNNVYPTWAGGTPTMTPDPDMYLSLHTDDPGVNALATDDEITQSPYSFTYTRLVVPRTAAEWTVTGDIAENVNVATFAALSGGSPANVTHLIVGYTGLTDYVMWRSELQTVLPVSAGSTPEFAAGDIEISEA